jgi:hypothetical protein
MHTTMTKNEVIAALSMAFSGLFLAYLPLIAICYYPIGAM